MIYKEDSGENEIHNKKIGILTINDYNNYGNRLQNYAVQEVLKSLGFEVETLINNGKKKVNTTRNYGVIDKLIRIRKMNYSEICKVINIRMNKKIVEKLIKERMLKFKEFTQKHILEAKEVNLENNLNESINNKYDFFVVGSDQIWNPNFRYGSPLDFLTFATKNKRIAYAPSFGVSSIPDEYIENYKIWLSQFNSLSVREEAGARIIKNLTGRNATVLIDPTLMLTKEKWLNISKEGLNKPKRSFLLTYFLGEVNKETKKIIKDIALFNNLEIVSLSDLKDKERYTADPGEFIDYINSATIFLTDSFHGVVFSILLEKPFIIFKRVEKTPSMNSRIDTILSIFQLHSRKWENIHCNDDILNIKYSHISLILENERSKTLNYLKEAFHV